MRPTAEQALKGLAETLLQVIQPALSDTRLQQQVQSVAAQLQRIAGEWDNEAAYQRDANERMAEFAGRSANVLSATAGPAGSGEWARAGKQALAALEDLPPDDGRLSSIYARQAALETVLVGIIETLEAVEAREPGGEASSLRRDLYAFLRRHASHGPF